VSGQRVGQLWQWQLADAEERALDQPVSPSFTSRFDAEAWLGEHWRELAAAGVATAQLRHGASAVAAAVPLHA
jgi:hypothetical protein